MSILRITNRSPIIDFDDTAIHPWVMISSSENAENNYSGGGILQLWKPLDILTSQEQQNMVIERN